jgi:beta-glucosidase
VIDFPSNVRTGDLGSSRADADPTKSVGPTAGIAAAAGAGITVVSTNTVPAAGSADLFVVIAGLTPQDEGEEYTGAGDRPSLSLDPKANTGVQDNLITQVAALGKPMVVVLEGGAAIDMPWLASVPAVVMAFYPGMVGGQALGQLLFGDVNFSGKLPVTWPTALTQLPTFNAGTTTTMDYHLGYRYFDQMALTPLFPYGYGLSYTTFHQYSNLQVPCSDVTKNGVVNVTVDITNTGAVNGDEVAMLFVSYPGSTNGRPVKELKGFTRVSINAGLTARVTIPLRIADLKFWNATASSWQVESGTVKIMVGPNAATLPLSDTLTVN